MILNRNIGPSNVYKSRNALDFQMPKDDPIPNKAIIIVYLHGSPSVLRTAFQGNLP